MTSRPATSTSPSHSFVVANHSELVLNVAIVVYLVFALRRRIAARSP